MRTRTQHDRNRALNIRRAHDKTTSTSESSPWRRKLSPNHPCRTARLAVRVGNGSTGPQAAVGFLVTLVLSRAFRRTRDLCIGPGHARLQQKHRDREMMSVVLAFGCQELTRGERISAALSLATWGAQERR